MATLDPITVHIAVSMDINGVPVQHVYEAPATSQLLDGKGGLLVNLHLDGKKLARAILPYLAEEIRLGMGMRMGLRMETKQQRQNSSSDFERYYRSDHGSEDEDD